MENSPKGVLIVNLGTPDAPEKSSVYRYLKEFLLDRRVIDISWLGRNLLVRMAILPFRTGSSTKLYQQLWTNEGSPLKVYGERVAAGVQQKLGNEYAVELAMRYQNPSIESAIKKLMEKRVSEINVFPMFPQYASATTGSVHEEVMRVIAKQEVIPTLHFINSYPTRPEMIEIFAENGRKLNTGAYDHVLFSFHGLPGRQLHKADPVEHCMKGPDCCKKINTDNQFCYSAQCYATAQALAAKLKLNDDNYTVCFQSRLGKEEWIKPYTSDIIEKRAKGGDKKLLVFCPAFVADCLETTIEIGHEYQEEFTALGGEKVQLVPSLNDHPQWIETIASMVRKP